MELNTHAVSRARLQARLLTNTLTPQAHRAKFYGEETTCRLCLLDNENVAHAVMKCPALVQTHVTLLQPMTPEDDEDIMEVLLSYTSDQLLYNLGSNNAMLSFINARLFTPTVRLN